jgi:FkbM family methyltransferase
VAIVRARCAVPILCVEGDDVFLPYLHRNLRGVADVEVEDRYVATSSDPEQRSVVERSGGTARLVDRSDGARNQTRALAEILAAHPTFERPDVLKIDTDGHDAAILRTAAPVLREVHPVLFFEHDPAMAADVGAPDPASIFTFLVELGYETFVLYANTGPRLEVLAAKDLDRLTARSAALEPASDLPYLDICAIHGDDVDLAAAIVGPDGTVS